MRSKLDTKSRLAAHIAAFVLLIMMLVYITPPPQPPASDNRDEAIAAMAAVPPVVAASSGAAAATATTLDETHAGATVAEIPVEQLRPPGAESVPSSAVTPVESAAAQPGTAEGIEPAVAAEIPAAVGTSLETTPGFGDTSPNSLENPESAPAPEGVEDGETGDPAVTASGPVSDDGRPAPDSALAAPGQEGGTLPEPEESSDPAGGGPAAIADPEAGVIVPQPDESGSLVVADAGTAAATPLADAGVEVVGDDVYWLDPRHDAESELAAFDEIGTLILLTPLPQSRGPDVGQAKTEMIPAAVDDLSDDAADRFVHLTRVARRPVIAAVMPGAQGAAFFKGSYLMTHRSFGQAGGFEELVREIEPELEEAGSARDEMVNRLYTRFHSR